jgi:uncharacterized protein
MKIRIDDIPETGLQVDLSREADTLGQALESIPLSPDVVVDPHVQGQLQLANSGKEISLDGTIWASMQLRCARCLAHFEVEKEVQLSLVLRVGSPMAQFTDVPDPAEADAIFVEGPELDLGQIILQELLLEVPMKPLCREDCPGLCPRCGALKGSAECTCAEGSKIDPRWEALARLKKGGKS